MTYAEAERKFEDARLRLKKARERQDVPAMLVILEEMALIHSSAREALN